MLLLIVKVLLTIEQELVLFFVRLKIDNEVQTIICEDVVKNPLIPHTLTLIDCQHFYLYKIFKVNNFFIKSESVLFMASGVVEEVLEEYCEDDDTEVVNNV